MSYMEQQMQQQIECGISEAERCYNRINELEAYVEQLCGGLNQAIELLVTALVEPWQITESEIHDLHTLEKSIKQKLRQQANTGE